MLCYLRILSSCIISINVNVLLLEIADSTKKTVIFFDDFEFDNNEAENLGEIFYTHIRLPYISIKSLTS